jgi:hypothetical protein
MTPLDGPSTAYRYARCLSQAVSGKGKWKRGAHMYSSGVMKSDQVMNCAAHTATGRYDE